MTGSKNGNEPETKSPRESGEDSEDESEILEESPCGRWSKRRQEVSCFTAILRDFGGNDGRGRPRGFLWERERKGQSERASEGRAGGPERANT